MFSTRSPAPGAAREASRSAVPNKQQASLFQVIRRAVGTGTILFAMFLYVVYATLSFAPPLILNLLVSYLEGTRDLSDTQLWGLVRASPACAPRFAWFTARRPLPRCPRRRWRCSSCRCSGPG